VGFLHATSGIQTQDFDTNALVSLRRAMQRVDNTGTPVRTTGIVLHPDDWADLELMTDTQGRFILTSGPADVSARRLWSVPVALSQAMPVGTWAGG
jgi:HK97 family phage major capsid protein